MCFFEKGYIIIVGNLQIAQKKGKALYKISINYLIINTLQKQGWGEGTARDNGQHPIITSNSPPE